MPPLRQTCSRHVFFFNDRFVVAVVSMPVVHLASRLYYFAWSGPGRLGLSKYAVLWRIYCASVLTVSALRRIRLSVYGIYACGPNRRLYTVRRLTLGTNNNSLRNNTERLPTMTSLLKKTIVFTFGLYYFITAWHYTSAVHATTLCFFGCPSVTRRCSIKMAKRIYRHANDQHDSFGILHLRIQRCWQNSSEITSNGNAKYTYGGRKNLSKKPRTRKHLHSYASCSGCRDVGHVNVNTFSCVILADLVLNKKATMLGSYYIVGHP